MKPIFLPLCLCLTVFPAFAGISFLSPDINSRNEVLFSVQADLPGQDVYKSLFLKNIDTGKLEQLTFFPEAMETLNDGTILQIRNRFGTGRYDTKSNSFSWIDDYRPFYAGGAVAFGMLQNVAPSPDGHWQVSIEPLTAARGRLVIYDATKGMRCIISDSIERGEIPVSWSPDSSVLLYSYNNTLYFARPEAFFSSSSVDERYRTIGTGTIRNVSWFSSSRLLYVSGTSVYRIQSSELFARSLYSPLIGIGELAGKLPCLFDGTSDSLCASPDGTGVLFTRNGRNIYYCPLEGDDYVSATRPALLPYLLLPGNTATLSFVWTQDGIPAIFSEAVEDGKKVMKAWKMTDIDGGKIFVPLSIPSGVNSVSLSSDGSQIAFRTNGGVLVYSASNWKETASWKDEQVMSIAWGDSSNLYIGGRETVRIWNCKTGSSSVLLLSSVNTYGWDEQGTTIIGDTSSLGRFSFTGGMKWVPSASLKMRPAASTNMAWRMYLDSGKGYFGNMLYARAATNPGGTKAMIEEPSVKTVVSPKETATSADQADVFSHGSRIGLKQIALVFDAMDTLDGLPEILNILDRYKIKATFFINGEFIRQHPAAVNEIVKAGHQTASLFFTTWDLSGTQYRIDEDFISRGLSRNEDDFFNATGQELTLLWHAPFYVSSSMIINAGKTAGYRYVSGDITVLDWVTREQSLRLPGIYRSAAELVEQIVASVRPGSIVPIRIGKVAGERSDYLYEKTDLVVNALIEAGYGIVTVDTLINNMQK